jgi:DNA adenine methylase
MSDTPGTFRYPGSKTTYANWIIEHIPEHHLYVEPFGGAASVLVAKPRSEIEVYNDLNGDCVDFFRAVRDRANELERWVEHTPYSRELFEQYVETYPDWPDDLVERAGRFLFVQSAAFGGKGVLTDSPTYSVAKAESERSWCNEVKWDAKPTHVTQMSKRFKSVNIERLDYAELIEKYDHGEAFFYFDPPYVDVGDDYYEVEDGGFDHARFVNTLHDMDGDWLVSYDQNIPPALDEYRTVSRTKVATMSAQTPEKVETLTMNYDVEGQPVMSELGQSGLNAYQ